MTMINQVLLGIDHGQTNIGIAFGQNGLAMPIAVVSAKDTEAAINEIAKTVAENKITKIIMGLPLTAEGKETAQSIKVRQFSKLLKIRLKKPVEFINEYDTTKEAIKESISYGISQKGRRKVDDISASLILKKYFDENAE